MRIWQTLDERMIDLKTTFISCFAGVHGFSANKTMQGNDEMVSTRNLMPALNYSTEAEENISF